MKKAKMDNIHHCPEELTMDILSRPPIKSLMRFKCASKSWRNLILSSDFAIHYFNRNKNNLLLHICQYSKNKIRSFFNDAVTDLHIPFLFNSHGYRSESIVGSSFVVWNPATREFRYLPKPGNTPGRGRLIPSGAGFDVILGGGVSDYKLVLVNFSRSTLKEFVPRVEVFTRSSNSWKQINEDLVPRLMMCSFNGVVVNGSVYWPALETEAVDYGIGGTPIRPPFVACFDMWKERFTRITGPSGAQHLGRLRRLGVLNGSQLAMFFMADSGVGCFDGWVMNCHDQSWTKLFTIALSPEWPLPIVRLVGFWLNGEIIIQIRDKVFLYDPSTEELEDFPAELDCNLFPYEETIFSV